MAPDVLDIRLVRENPELIQKDLAKRNAPDKAKLLADVIQWDQEWRKALAEADRLKRRRNEITREIAEAKKAGNSTDKLRKEAGGLPKKIDALDQTVDELAAKVREDSSGCRIFSMRASRSARTTRRTSKSLDGAPRGNSISNSS